MARNGVRFNLHKLLVQRKDERIEGRQGCWDAGWLAKGLCQQQPTQSNLNQTHPTQSFQPARQFPRGFLPPARQRNAMRSSAANCT